MWKIAASIPVYEKGLQDQLLVRLHALPDESPSQIRVIVHNVTETSFLNALRRSTSSRIIEIKSRSGPEEIGPIPFQCHGHLPQVLWDKWLLEAASHISSHLSQSISLHVKVIVLWE